MPILVLHRGSGRITAEPGRIDEYARRCGLQMAPAILDCDVCAKLLRDGEWIATARFVYLSQSPSALALRINATFGPLHLCVTSHVGATSVRTRS